jgi:hypothetical protein
MKVQNAMRHSQVTIAALSYELNSVALKVAAEAEQLAYADSSVDDAHHGSVGLAYKIHCLIDQFREAAMVLGYARHSGHLPPS